MVEAGSEPNSTLIETQATYSRDIQNLTIAENNHDLALLTLAQLLQLPYENFDVEVIEIDTPSANLKKKHLIPILGRMAGPILCMHIMIWLGPWSSGFTWSFKGQALPES